MKKILFLVAIIVLFFLVKIDQEFKPDNLPDLQMEARAKASGNVVKEFTTDACSIFPNKIKGIDITDICIEHDMAYWAGGTEEQRLLADKRLRREANSRVDHLGDVMYWLFRFTGNSKFPTPWKWGYGCE